MKFIDLSENELSGSIPLEVKLLPRLKSINFSHNTIVGPVGGFIPSLAVMNVSHNELFGPLSARFGQETPILEVIDLSFNHIDGIIPESIGEMVLLEHMDLSNNNLYGSIPHSIRDLRDLKNLFLNDNSLMGTLPHTLSREGMKLSQLHIHNNDLSGLIPSTLSKFDQLSVLYVDGNKFTGNIPLSLCEMQLNGFIPGKVEGMNGCYAIACPANSVSPDGMFPCKHCNANEYSPYLGRDKACFSLIEKEILEQLYTNTNGPVWKDHTGWDEKDSNPCDYFGVTCDEEGNVIAIKLSNNGLVGEIPENLGMLRHLNVLGKHHNPDLYILLF